MGSQIVSRDNSKQQGVVVSVDNSSSANIAQCALEISKLDFVTVMQTRSMNLIQDNASISDSEWLRLLSAELQLIADLSYSDIVLWRPNRAGIKASDCARNYSEGSGI